jgi:hypothetical protein
LAFITPLKQTVAEKTKRNLNRLPRGDESLTKEFEQEAAGDEKTPLAAKPGQPVPEPASSMA